MYAEFTDDLVTGNEMIDTQHKELICKINDLLKSCEERSNQSGAARMLNFLADYTEYHFNEEEALQESINYPGIKEHKEKHEELRRTVQELHEMLTEEEGPTDAFVEKVSEKVRDWLYYHIQTFDRSVAEFKFMKQRSGHYIGRKSCCYSALAQEQNCAGRNLSYIKIQIAAFSGLCLDFLVYFETPFCLFSDYIVMLT